MEKIKEYKYIILIILVILGFIFYWFQLRPLQIRKGCIKNYPDAFRVPTNDDNGRLSSIGNWIGDTDKTGYQKCLRENGLNN